MKMRWKWDKNDKRHSGIHLSGCFLLAFAMQQNIQFAGKARATVFSLTSSLLSSPTPPVNAQGQLTMHKVMSYIPRVCEQKPSTAIFALVRMPTTPKCTKQLTLFARFWWQRIMFGLIIRWINENKNEKIKHLSNTTISWFWPLCLLFIENFIFHVYRFGCNASQSEDWQTSKSQYLPFTVGNCERQPIDGQHWLAVAVWNALKLCIPNFAMVVRFPQGSFLFARQSRLRTWQFRNTNRWRDSSNQNHFPIQPFHGLPFCIQK